MNNGVTLNFHARAPVRYKKSVVRSFVNRIYNSSSNWSHFHEGLSKAKEILHDNQYPTMFYEPVIHDVLEKIILKKQGLEKKSFDSDVTGKKLFYLQYRGNESTKFISRLLKIGAPIEPIYTMVKTRHVLPSTKPPVNKMYRSNLIYQIECSGCKSKYVGLTTRHLISRVNEHFSPNGTMTKHCQSFGCNIDNPLEATSILDSSYRNIIHLSIYEALYIREINPSINTKDEYISRRLRIRV